MALMLAALALACLTFTAGARAAGPQLGFSFKYFGDHPHRTAHVDVAAQSVDTVLTEFRWRSVQPTCDDIRNHVFDWHKLNHAMTYLQSKGLTVVGTLKGGPLCTQAEPDPEKGTQPSRAYLDEWARFASLVIQRYGPQGTVAPVITDLEVWSEENLRSWTTGPRGYAHYFVRVYDAVERVSSGLRVIVGGPGFCCHPTRFVKQALEVPEFRRRARYIGAHTYSPSPGVAMHRLRRFRDVIGKRPIVITEHGWSTCPDPKGGTTFQHKCVNRTKQARYLGEYIRDLRQARWDRVRAFYWFQIQDFATNESVAGCEEDPKDFYGFYDWYGEPKPSAGVWETLTGTDLPDTIAQNFDLRECIDKKLKFTH